MRCFYHRDLDAVGTCKSCGRGICGHCLVEFEKGLACRDRCESEVQALIDLLDRTLEVAPTSHRMIRGSRKIYIASGFCAVIIGGVILSEGIRDPRLHLFVYMGSVILAFGLYLLVSQAFQRTPASRENLPDQSPR